MGVGAVGVAGAGMVEGLDGIGAGDAGLEEGGVLVISGRAGMVGTGIDGCSLLWTVSWAMVGAGGWLTGTVLW